MRSADDAAAEGDPVPAWRPDGLAIRPALAAAVGDLAEISAVRVDRIERFIAARCGWVEFAPLEQKCRAVRRPGWVVVRPVAATASHGAGQCCRARRPRCRTRRPCWGALRGSAFAVLAAAPTSVDEAVAEAAVLAARLLRLHVDLSPVGASQDAELIRLLTAGARPADAGHHGDEGCHVLADRRATNSACCAAARHPTTPRTSLKWLHRLNRTLDDPRAQPGGSTDADCRRRAIRRRMRARG